MEHMKEIFDNPFRVLGAVPEDDRRRLIELSDEASLLGEDNAEDSLNQLLNSQRRLDAEISWFPGCTSDQTEAILAYPDAKEPAPYPQLPEGSALAAFNAAHVLLETWQVSDVGSAVALCKSLAGLDAKINTEALMEQINAGREKAGFQLITDVSDVRYRLDNLRHSVSQRLLERMEQVKGCALTDMMNRVADVYKDAGSNLSEVLVSAYELKIHEQAERMQDEIVSDCKSALNQGAEYQRKTYVNKVLRNLKEWHKITAPVRRVNAQKGLAGDDARKIFHEVREMAVNLQNKFNMTDDCFSLTRELHTTFSDVPGAREMLDKDLDALNKIRQQMAALRQAFNR